jgi:hypothetical protein
MKKENFNVMSNIKTLEKLKSQLLYIVADFFGILTKGSSVAQETILQCISSGIIIFYFIGEKLGYSYVTIDDNIRKNLIIGISENDELEKQDRSLSRLNSHISKRS